MNEVNDRRTGAPRERLVRASERDKFKTASQHRRDPIAEGACLSVSAIETSDRR